MDLKHLFDMAVTGAEKSFHDDGEIPQIAIAISGNNELIVIPCPWKDERERVVVLYALRSFFKSKRVQQYAFVAEAWASTYNPDRDTLVMPSKSDRRKEVVMVSATDGTNSISGFMDILRPFDGVASLANMELFPEGHGDGALLSLLNDA